VDRALVQRFCDVLQLQTPPVGLAFVEGQPQGIAHTTTGVPSACTFWRLAERGVFYATASDHQECPVGMITLGFMSPTAPSERARSLVQMMAEVGYFSPDEISGLPVVQKPHDSIVYGRLDQFPLEPEVILSLLDARQAMLIAEAEGTVNWLQSGQVAFGRPTCGIIPRTLHSGRSSLSFGCVGARTYAALKPSEAVLALPGAQFAGLIERLETVVSANEQLAPFHRQQKERFNAWSGE
jgi:uncharacterized protein (DUF169 family)